MIQTAIALLSTAEASNFLANENSHRNLQEEEEWSFFSWFGGGKGKGKHSDIVKLFKEYYGESSNETIEGLYNEIPLGEDLQITPVTFVQWVMTDAGLELDDEMSGDNSLYEMYDYMDKNKDGNVGLDEFMCMVRGRVSRDRMDMIHETYPGEPGWFVGYYDFTLN